MKLLLAASLLFAATAAPALASDEVLHLNNRTGYTISEIYIAPTSTDNWEEDIMGDDALAPNTSVNVDFSRSEDTCKWDLKAVYDDGTNAVWKNIDLCKISTITMFYNAETDVTSAKYE
ncbi:MAG: argininosuccinate lyase [Sphingomonadales bacterium]|nr:MAG: argininosuccinate lyase [Sphingomonadales bacterium]